MPSSPVFTKIFRGKRNIKIFRKFHSEKLCNSQCYINSTGKIRIELYGIKQHTKKHPQSGIFGGTADNYLYHRNDAVCHGEFLKISPQDSLDGKTGPVHLKAMCLQNFLHIIVQGNRSLHQQGKEGNRRNQLQRISDPFCMFPVYFCLVRNRHQSIICQSERHIVTEQLEI